MDKLYNRISAEIKARFVVMKYRRRHIQPKIYSLRKRKSLFTRPMFWLALILLMLVAGAAYGILFYERFQVKNLVVSGTQRLQKEEVESFVWQEIAKKPLLLPSKSIFLVSQKELSRILLEKFPGIGSVQITKNYPDGLVVAISERQPFAVFCATSLDEDCFYMDETGVLFEKIQGIEVSFLIVRQDVNSGSFIAGQSAIPANAIQALRDVKNSLKSNFNIDIKEAFVSNPLVFTTSENWKAYFDPEGDMDFQINKMNLLLKDEIPESVRKNMQYLYLQYKDRAYHK